MDPLICGNLICDRCPCSSLGDEGDINTGAGTIVLRNKWEIQ
jgi:hypothetical protein